MINRFKQTKVLVDGIPKIWDLTHSSGSYLLEKKGKTFLDFHTGYGSLPLGYNHPKLIDKINSNPATNSHLYHRIANSDFYTEEYLNYLETFNRLAKPKNFDGGLFLIDTGTLTIDNAVKACFHHKNGIYGDKPLSILHLSRCFHGRSGFALNMTHSDPVKTGGYVKFSWPRLPLVPLLGEREVVCDHNLTIAQDLIWRHRDNLAGFILEGGIQCEGGDRHLNPYHIKRLVEFCQKLDLPIIVDEVQTGFWSTGRVWGYQHLGIEPDIICFGKKANQCGIVAGGVFNDLEDSVFTTSGRINSTWGGNTLDMIRSTAIMEIVQEDGLDLNVIQAEQMYVKKMKLLEIKYPQISNVRAKGVIMAFDLPDKEIRDRFILDIMDLGLLCLAAGEKTVRFRPHLAVTRDEMEHALEILERYFYRLNFNLRRHYYEERVKTPCA